MTSNMQASMRAHLNISRKMYARVHYLRPRMRTRWCQSAGRSFKVSVTSKWCGNKRKPSTRLNEPERRGISDIWLILTSAWTKLRRLINLLISTRSCRNSGCTCSGVITLRSSWVTIDRKKKSKMYARTLSQIARLKIEVDRKEKLISLGERR